MAERGVGAGVEPWVRIATPEDGEELARVHVAAWQAGYRNVMPAAYLDGLDPVVRGRRWRELLSGDHRDTLVAGRTAGVQGFVVFGASRDEDAPPGLGELVALNVHPDAWGSGIGSALHGAALAGLLAAGFREAMLWVIEANPRARRFYEHHGWRADGEIRREEIGGSAVAEVRYRRSLP